MPSWMQFHWMGREQLLGSSQPPTHCSQDLWFRNDGLVCKIVKEHERHAATALCSETATPPTVPHHHGRLCPDPAAGVDLSHRPATTAFAQLEGLW
ncbi:hypothetical protein PVAP13_2KG073132 [Panicum virgatum]|uniref:Uncharacterized protein n=1 Tax=Panicum virgatum TaxID=38727 RepID=A0A8T0W694_PANVG|nr:hypothetical protein PVAP13_2KG073132 [Panicum virgatum]